jgi:hypothetical protein
VRRTARYIVTAKFLIKNLMVIDVDFEVVQLITRQRRILFRIYTDR